MADNETSYLPIGTCLEQIEKAVYGREVRKAIHDGIAQCYDDTVEGVNAAQQAASDTQEVINNAVTATREANTAAAEASNVKVEQTVSGDTVTFTTTKRDGTTVSTSFQKPNVVVSKDEGSGEFSVTATGWNGEEIIATIPDPSEEVKSRATIAAVSKVKTALSNPLTVTDGMDAPAVKTVVTLEPKQDLHGYDHPWVGGSGKNLCPTPAKNSGSSNGVTYVVNSDGSITLTGTADRTIGITFSKPFMVKAGVNYILSGCPSGGGTSSYRLDLRTNETTLYIPTGTTQVVDNGVAAQFTPQEDATITVATRVAAGYAFPSGGVTFYPMIMSESEPDRTYAPYSNICPIEGYDTVRVTATGSANILLGSFYNLSVGQTGITNTDNQFSINYGMVKKGVIYTYTTDEPGAVYGYVAQGTLTETSTWCAEYPTRFVESVTGKRNNVYYKIFEAKIDGWLVWRCTLNFKESALYEGSDIPNEYAAPTRYSSTSLSVAQAAGATVYGGTVTLNEDGSGTLVVDRGIEVITKDSPIGKGMKDTVWYLNKTMPMAKLPDYRRSLICDTVEVRQNHSAMTNNLYNVPGITGYGDNSNGYPNSNWIYFTDGKSTTHADIVAWLTDHPLSVVYPLRTLTTYTLTASQLRTLTGENHVWTDGTKLELTYRADKYADIDKLLNAIPTGTKTGDPAVFTDGADDLPFEKLTIAVEPHQEGSGDPSPDNIRPITGWDEVKVTRCGKNLLENHCKVGQVTENGITWTVNKDGSVVINGTSTGNTYLYLTETGGMTLKPGTYTRFLGSDKSFSGIRLNCRIGSAAGADAFGTVPDAQTATISEDTVIVVRLYVPSGNTYSNITVYPMIVSGTYTTATFPAWEPYASTTLPISLKYTTGSTVYGGTVTINRDGTGSVVVDRAIVKFTGSESFTRVGSSGNYGYRCALSPMNIRDLSKTYCSHFVPSNSVSYGTNDVNVFVIPSTNDYIAFYVAGISESGTASDFTEWVKTQYANGTPLTFAYPLAIPTTYTLTAPQLTTLLGNNTVWCDAGQVTVKYKRDIGKALDAMVASLIEAGLYVDMGAVDVVPGA